MELEETDLLVAEGAVHCAHHHELFETRVVLFLEIDAMLLNEEIELSGDADEAGVGAGREQEEEEISGGEGGGGESERRVGQEERREVDEVEPGEECDKIERRDASDAATEEFAFPGEADAVEEALEVIDVDATEMAEAVEAL